VAGSQSVIIHFDAKARQIRGVFGTMRELTCDQGNGIHCWLALLIVFQKLFAMCYFPVPGALPLLVHEVYFSGLAENL
jgi:hypothetical protein